MPVWVLDRNEHVAAILDNGPAGACPFFNDTFTEQLDGVIKYELTVPLDHPNTEYLVEENYLAILDLDNIFRLFRIKRTGEKSGRNGERTLYVYAENAALELYHAVADPFSYASVSLSSATSAVLGGTRWSVGIMEDATNRQFVVTRHITKMKALAQIAVTWGMELRYRVTIDNGKVTGRYVDMLARRGAANGKTFTYAKDLEEITRTKDSSGLYTALVGVGKTDRDGVFLDFADVEWSTALGDPVDKPLGQNWVGDPDALQNHGLPHGGTLVHLMGIHQDSSEDNASELLASTWEKLQEVNTPKLTYQVDVGLLESLPPQTPNYVDGQFEHEKVRLGDDVIVKDFTFDPPLAVEARVIEAKISLSDNKKNTVTLGNFRTLVVDSVDPRSIEKYVYEGEGAFLRDTAPSTTVVAAYNSKYPERADYRCDGTDDDVQIRQAIVDAATIGGSVLLLDGDYYLGAWLELENGVFFKGQGQSTVIHTGGYEIGPGYYASSDLRWADMTIDMPAGTYWAMYIYSCNGGFVDNVHFVGVGDGVALIFAETDSPVVVRDCSFTNINGAILIDRWVGDHSYTPITGNMQIKGCTFVDCITYGIRSEGGEHVSITGNRFEGCALSSSYGSIYAGPFGYTGNDISITDNTIDVSAGSAYSIVVVAAAGPFMKDVVVANNRIIGGGSGASGGWGKRPRIGGEWR